MNLKRVLSASLLNSTKNPFYLIAIHTWTTIYMSNLQQTRQKHDWTELSEVNKTVYSMNTRYTK